MNLFSGEQREVILDFILERKRMDDLASSIIDGRFKEQKVNFIFYFEKICKEVRYTPTPILIQMFDCLLTN